MEGFFTNEYDGVRLLCGFRNRVQDSYKVNLDTTKSLHLDQTSESQCSSDNMN